VKAEFYKPSQFNYTTFNDAGDLLIYNTFSGVLCKALAKNSDKVLQLLSEETVDRERIEYPLLAKAQYLVPSYADEHALLHSMTERFLNSSLLELTILPTHQCNCRCVYCYEDFQSGIMSEKTQRNLVKFVKKRLRHCTGLYVSWFGGEPLVAMDVIRNLSAQFIEICKTEKKRYTASMTTNGTLLTLETLRELQKYRVLIYQITIDGSRETHDMQRPLVGGGSSYDLIMDNLLKIKETIKVKNFQILLRTNITKQSFSDMESYIRKMEKLFGGDTRFQISFNVAADWGGERIESYRNNLLVEDDNVPEKMNSLISQLNTTLDFGGGLGAGEGICFNPGCHVDKNNSFLIEANGSIGKCAQQTRSNFPEIGNLSGDDFYLDEFELVKWTSSVHPKIHEKCTKCFLLPIGCYRSYSCILRRYRTKYMDEGYEEEPECPQIFEKLNSDLCMREKNGNFYQLEGVEFDAR